MNTALQNRIGGGAFVATLVLLSLTEGQPRWIVALVAAPVGVMGWWLRRQAAALAVRPAEGRSAR